MNKYNLKELLTKELEIETSGKILKIKFDGVQIPMIQRDYAQGRPAEKEIRDRFLDAIFGALISGKGLELDFVYGSVKKYGKSNFFIPLDGQQRLTTLFLLYWYAGQRELLIPDELRENQRQLACFSYDTRPTARKFCESLCGMERIGFSRLPSAVIKDASWFYNAYEKDPTVRSMLNMIDEIHHLYELKQTVIYDNLATLKFYILPLDGFGLTDELYIKMNARGKQLTDFENFKADLTKWMKDEQNAEASLFQQETLYQGRPMPYYLAIGLKIDNEWTNFFWGFTRDAEKEKDKLVDPLFLRFFNRFLLNEYVLSTPLSQEALEKSDEFVYLYGNDKKETPFEYSNFGFYQPLIGSYAAISRIESTLDTISQYYDALKLALPPSWNPSDNWRFFDPEISQTQRILFLAICGYAQKFAFEEKPFKDWIRIVWNIINNPDIRSVPAMIASMKLIKALAAHAAGIYTFLGSDASLVLRISNNNNTELSEEHRKAKLIMEDPLWETTLIKGESHGLFQGSIGFLLSGEPSLDDFINRLGHAVNLFGKNGTHGVYAEGHNLMRATISKVDNFHDLEHFKMEDSERNWSLLLRRNKTVRGIVGSYCALENEVELENAVLVALTTPSAISWDQLTSDSRIIRHVHRQLYQDTAFHLWMQERNAVDLHWRDDHIYIKKYRAWYDLVMLDTHRNELITMLIERFGLQTDSRCGQSDFYKGSSVTLEKAITGITISLEFDHASTLRAGLKKTKNFFESGQDPVAGGPESKDWYYVKYYDYTGISSAAQMSSLAETIGQEVFDVLQSVS